MKTRMMRTMMTGQVSGSEHKEGWLAICEKHCIHAWTGDGGLHVVAYLVGGSAFPTSALIGTHCLNHMFDS